MATAEGGTLIFQDSSDHGVISLWLNVSLFLVMRISFCHNLKKKSVFFFYWQINSWRKKSAFLTRAKFTHWPVQCNLLEYPVLRIIVALPWAWLFQN